MVLITFSLFLVSPFARRAVWGSRRELESPLSGARWPSPSWMSCCLEPPPCCLFVNARCNCQGPGTSRSQGIGWRVKSMPRTSRHLDLLYNYSRLKQQKEKLSDEVLKHRFVFRLNTTCLYQALCMYEDVFWLLHQCTFPLLGLVEKGHVISY